MLDSLKHESLLNEVKQQQQKTKLIYWNGPINVKKQRGGQDHTQTHILTHKIPLQI